MADATYDQTTEAVGKEVVGPDQPDYKKWYARIRKARKVRKDWEKRWKVEKCEEFFLGKQWKNQNDGPRVLNHFLATVKVTQTNLLLENPKALVRPKPGNEMTSARKASLAEQVLTAIMAQDDNFEDAASLGLLQNFFRVGVLKVVYDPVLEPNPNFGRAVAQKDGDGNPILDQNTGEPQPMVDPATGQPIQEPPMVVSDDTYRFEWVDAKCMLFPDSGPYMRKWRWIGEEVTVPLEDAKEDERFPAELRMQFKCNVKEDKKSGEKRSSYGEGEEDEESELFRYCELYDREDKRWLCIAEDQDFDDPLIDDVLPEGIEDDPYAILPGWTPILGPDPCPWPLPHTYPWLDAQEEYNIRREQEMQGAKRSARKVFYTGDMFDNSEEALNMLQSSRDMEGVRVQDIMRVPVAFAEPTLNPAIWQDSAAILNDWRIITGQTGAKLSGSTDANTATEASFIERASTLRDAELQKAVYKWLRTALRKMLQLVRATLTTGMWVKLRGMTQEEMAMYVASVHGLPPEMLQLLPGLQQYLVQTFGNDKMEHVSREDLTFEADIEIVPGSTRPRSLPQEKAQLLEFLQLFAQSPQIALVPSLMQEIASKYEFLSPQVVQECQQLAMMMVQMNANQAGRNQGGQNTAKENTPGQGNSEGTQQQAQAARGVG